MRAILVSLLLLGSLSCLASPAAKPPAASPAPAAPKPWAIMALDQGPVMFAQCSRPAPREKGPFWSPAPAQIEELEGELAAYLRQQGHAKEADGLARFLRQYVGFVRTDRKLIYLNAFPVYLVEADEKMCRERPELMPKELCEPDHWRHEGVFACDGGDDFWGLEYDPESKAFSALEFNGGF
jgi:hypothetical protein